MEKDDINLPGAGAGRIVGTVFGFGFAFIGLSVVIFLWSQPFDAWDSPPLFFRIFGSIIGIMFVTLGGTMGISALTGRIGSAQTLGQQMRQLGRMQPATAPPTADSSTPLTYRCSHCGAPLPQHADVSPLGDVKCPHCATWFNIHQQSNG